MRLLDKLLGKASGTGNPYLDAGVALTVKLVKNLDLNDWKNKPIIYTPEEAGAIDRELASFGSIVNDKLGGPDLLPEI